MCDCIQEINNKLAEAGLKQKVKHYFALSKPGMTIGSRIGVECERTDGSRKKLTAIFASFCPFCGFKINEAP